MGFNPDPITEVYIGLLDTMRNDPDVGSIVAVGNLIKRSSALANGTDFIRPKEDKLDFDFPEIDIVPAGGTLDVPNTSSSIVIDQGFEIVIGTPTARLDAKFFPLFFAIVRAFVRVGCTGGVSDVVERLSLSNYTDDENLDAVLKGLEGWSSFITINTRIRLKTKSLL